MPDTIAAYREAHAIDPRMASALLERQMAVIERGASMHVEAVRARQLDKLAANGRFLDERLGITHRPPSIQIQ